MSSDFRKANRDLLEEFIRAYQNLPCLWRVKSPEYRDRRKRNTAYDVLLKIYKSVDKHADRDAIIKKINSFRTNYRKERRKVEASRNSGVSEHEVYQPILWYYHLFGFLEDQDIPISSSTNLDDVEDEIGEQSTHSTQDLEDSHQEEDPFESTPKIKIHSGYFKRINDNDSALDNFERINNKRCDDNDSVSDNIEHNSKRFKSEDDRYSILGKTVSLKMRDITSNTQRLLAEKLINEALFMAEIGQLTMYHSISVSSTSSTMKFSAQDFDENI